MYLCSQIRFERKLLENSKCQCGTRKRSSAMNLVIFTISASLCLARGLLNLHNAYRVVPIANQPGLYFERISGLRLQHVDWRVTVFIDVQHLMDDFPSVKQQLTKTLKECCSVYKGCGRCRELLHTEYLDGQISHARDLVQEVAELAKDSTFKEDLPEVIPRTIRKRSVPLGFIGSLSKSLFGTLNEEDAEYINKQIDQLYSDQANLTHLTGRQMHITRSQLQQLHEDHLEEAKRMETLEKRVNFTGKLLSDIDHEINRVSYNGELYNYAARVETRLDRYIHACERYRKIITKARGGRYDSAVLTTAQLRGIRREIQDRAPDFEFPLTEAHMQGELLAQIARTDIVYHSGRVIIVVHIPLLDRMEYTLYRLHAWPVPQTGGNGTGSAHIAAATPYIAVSADRRTYFHADATYIAACKRIEHRHLCTMETPLNVISTSDQCEIQMLIRPTPAAYRSCDVRVRARHRAFWTHLPAQGGWLYSLAEEETIHVLCPGLIDVTTTLSGAGILYLSPNCVGRTQGTALTGIRVYESQEKYIYTPAISLNVSELVPGIGNLHHEQLKGLLDDLTSESSERMINSGKSNAWKYRDEGESLFDIEEQIHEIGTHKRSRRQQQHLFLAGFSLQGIIVAIIIIYTGRAAIQRIVSRLCCIRRRGLDLEKGTRLRTTGSPLEGYRSQAPQKKHSSAVSVEEDEALAGTESEREEKTARRGLPRQHAVVD